MRRIGITISLVVLVMAALAMPGSASAGHLSRADFKSVSKYCKALRSEMGTKAFKRAFGKGKRHRQAHRRCIARRGAIPKVKLRSLTPPSPANECPPGTQPEPPAPVKAFAVNPIPCIALPAPTQPAPSVDDEDDDPEADEDDADDDGDDEPDDEHDSNGDDEDSDGDD